MNSKKKLLYFLLFFFFFNKNIIRAQTFDSASFHIDFGNFNMTSGKKTSTSYTLTDTVGQNAPGQYDSTGYVLKAGFQYLYDKNIPISFSISDLDLNFGNLTPNIASTITNTITISTPSGHGYDILAIANHPLKALGTISTIPDTRCDSGTCSESVSDIWVSNNTYGFGFNASGDGTSTYFPSANHFRHFADGSINETAKIFMSESVPVENHSALIKYKINIPSTQTAATYENSINFIAVLKY